MSFGQAISTCFSNYVTFEGRAARSEYWYWMLFVFIVSFVLSIVDRILPFGLLQVLFALATILPGVAVGCRRLHDIGRSGRWWLIAFIPVVGAILLIVWACQPSTPGPNQYGPVPA
jgi:uncharacterized membrane protein YhaH (DUF805 family)